MNPRLKQLGREVAESQQRALDALDLEAQGTRFLLHALAAPAPRRAPRALRAAALLAAALALALWWSGRDAALSFRAAGDAGREDTWLAAPESAALPLDFSDGSSVIVDAGGRARVTDRSRRGARIVLERGALRARIAHREGARWRIDAGPFQVQVVGTAFDVSWRDERFALQLHEGAVRVLGPTLAAPRELRAGQRLDLDLGETAPARTPVPRITPLAADGSAARGASAAPASPPRARGAGAHPPPGRGASVARPRSSWRKLAAAGAHAQSFDALVTEGFGPLLRTGSASDLALAGDVARLAGHPAEARAAWIALRARFPATPAAAEAAFALGRLTFERPGAVVEAARWFETYLQEQPGGVFAREAAGRSIECHVQLGRAEHARRAARDYLDLFPTGPHAALARSVLRAGVQDAR